MKMLAQSADQAMLLDASKSETFVIQCRISVQSLAIKRVSPGQLYVFVLIQDATGGHAFNWGSNALNATAINPAPNGVTVQCFIGDVGGVMRANAPGIWSNI